MSLTGWWLSHPSEKWWNSSVGMIIPFPTEWKVIKFMFQTINQIDICCPLRKKPLGPVWSCISYPLPKQGCFSMGEGSNVVHPILNSFYGHLCRKRPSSSMEDRRLEESTVTFDNPTVGFFVGMFSGCYLTIHGILLVWGIWHVYILYIYIFTLYIYINNITIYILYNITAIIYMYISPLLAVFLQNHAIFGLTQFLPKATIAAARQRPHQNPADTDCFIGILIN